MADFLARHLPGAVGPRDLHEDVPLHDDRPTATSFSTGCPTTRMSSSRLGAAHGYKFASVFGRILAELALDGATPSAPEIEGFRIDRPILLEKDPATSFMV